MPSSLAPVLMLAGLASGQGKTTVVAALAAALRQRGHRVRVFKAGPDFIDPMVLEQASGAPVFNLDDRMVGLAESRQRVLAAAAQADMVLIEGVMGLYDGPPSAADLARGLDVPVAIVLNASAMAQTFGALLHGLATYPEAQTHTHTHAHPHAPPLRLLGAVANRVNSASHAQMLADSLRPAAPGQPAPQLLACLPTVERSIPERHLGLASEAVADIAQSLQTLAAAVDDATVTRLLALPRWQPPPATEPVPPAPAAALLAGRCIAVARDAAFRFLYPANLEWLTQMGAHLAFFSPLADEAVPPEANALWLPGGYPELYASSLAQAERWADSVRHFAARGQAIWAECGGMMALAEQLHSTDGHAHTLVGLLPGHVHMQARLAGLGVQQLPIPGEAARHWPALRGHTFHYSRLETPLAPLAHAQRLRGGAGEALWQHGALRCSYFHAYFPSSPLAAAWLFAAPAG